MSEEKQFSKPEQASLQEESVQKASANGILQKLLSPQNRKKTIIASAVFVVLLVVVVFCSFFSAKSVAKRFVKAIALYDYPVMERLYYGNLKEEVMDGSRPEDFYARESEYLNTRINSWRKYTKAKKSQQDEWIQKNYGKCKIRTSVNDFVKLNISDVPKSLFYDSDDYLDLRDSSLKYKRVSVEVEFDGKAGYDRETVSVNLVRLGLFWKCLGFNGHYLNRSGNY